MKDVNYVAFSIGWNCLSQANRGLGAERSVEDCGVSHTVVAALAGLDRDDFPVICADLSK